MDSLIMAAARALAAGDALGALNRVALRQDPPALALRGIAMAQLGDLTRARALVRAAARAFGPREAVARARCVVAEAEIALAARELGWPQKALSAAQSTLEAHGDTVNAAHARYLGIRRLLLLGRIEEGEQALAGLTPQGLPPALQGTHELLVAGLAMRRLRIGAAREALARARQAAVASRIAALVAEVESAARALAAPAGSLMSRGRRELLSLAEVEALMGTPGLIVDACRHEAREGGTVIALKSRPVLFVLLRALAQGWPGDVTRGALIARAFRVRQPDESHRVRLRVEMGRLRRLLQPLAEVKATAEGFMLIPGRDAPVRVLEPPVEGAHGAVLALLADGEPWASSALALALATSQRTVQRSLDALAASGQVQCFGRGRSRRWLTPPVGSFTTTLLLPAPLPGP